MTDIQRHLNKIIKATQQYMREAERNDYGHPSNNYDNWKSLVASNILPDSYLITDGILYQGSRHHSGYISNLVCDRVLVEQGDYPIPQKDHYYKATDYFHVNTALMIIACLDQRVFSREYNGLEGLLKWTRGIKQLKPSAINNFPKIDEKSVGQTRQKIPKYRLPLVVIMMNRFIKHPTADYNLIDKIVETMQRVSNNKVKNLPDYIYWLDYNLMYRNPMLDRKPLTGDEICITHTPELKKPRACYVCKRKYFRRHFFYERLCVTCGDKNYRKRHNQADLNGRIALVTGGRVKIGYATALNLLRNGAQVIVTSRFPHDTARRYAEETDFNEWQDRLHIYGLDLRHIPSVQAFIQHLYATYPHLDILINNAAQTIRRPPEYYAHLMALELTPRPQLPPELQALLPFGTVTSNLLANGNTNLLNISETTWKSSAQLSQVSLVNEETDQSHFPIEQYDADQQQMDKRPVNSWELMLDEVQVPEMLEVQLVNAISPEILVSQLKKLIITSPHEDRYVVNVSAVEGQFKQTKTGVHVHTNMAKAALNMLTYSAGADYAESGIYMTSVDPGWVSDQSAYVSDEDRAHKLSLIPLDHHDGASRICDPIFMGINEQDYVFARFLKDYAIHAW